MADFLDFHWAQAGTKDDDAAFLIARAL